MKKLLCLFLFLFTVKSVFAVNLSSIIKFLFPTAKFGMDYIVDDNLDGKGQFISKWNTAKLGIKPTLEYLKSKESAYTIYKTTSAAKALKEALIKEQIDKTAREQAIIQLKIDGKLPADYK